MLPDIIAFTENDGHGQAEVCCAAGDVQWTAKTGAVVELPTMADIEHIANQQPGATLTRDDGRPIVIGRDAPTNEQLAIAEADGELIPDAVPDVFAIETIDVGCCDDFAPEVTLDADDHSVYEITCGSCDATVGFIVDRRAVALGKPGAS